MISGNCKCGSDKITILVGGSQIKVNVSDVYSRSTKRKINDMRSCLYICGNFKCQHPRGEKSL